MAFAAADWVYGFEETADLTLTDQALKRTSTDGSQFIGTGHAIVDATDFGKALSLPSGAGIKRHTITSDATSPYYCFAITRDAATARQIITSKYTGLGNGLTVTWKADGTFEVFDRSGTSKGTTNTAYTGLNQRYYLQISYGAASSSENLKFYVDGTLDKTFTGDWRGGGVNSAGLTEFHIGSDGTNATTGANLTVDDFSLAHEGGSFTDLKFGNLKVEVLVPTSDTSTHDLTPSTGTDHFAVVDETPPETTNNLSSSPLAGATTRTDLFGYPEPTTDDDTTKRIYAISANAYLTGPTGTGADDRLRLRVNGNVGTEQGDVSNFNGNGNLATVSQLLFTCPFGLPYASASPTGAGVTISSFFTNYTFGPRVVRSATATASLLLYTWSLSVAKSYYVPSAGWHVSWPPMVTWN